MNSKLNLGSAHLKSTVKAMRNAKNFLLIFSVAILIVTWIALPRPSDSTSARIPEPASNDSSEAAIRPEARTDATPAPAPPAPNQELATSLYPTSNLHPPDKPAWEILRDYQTGGARGRAQEDKVLSALSYCINTQGSSEALLVLKSRGVAAPGEIESLEKNIEDHSKFCGRLLPSDFQVRADIVRSRAETGDVKAMMEFLDVGPGGFWPNDGIPPGWTQEQKYAWQQEAIRYLNKAAENNEINALNALAMIYGNQPSGDDKTEPFFSSFHDPVKAYAYAYAWTLKAFRKVDPYQEKARDSYLQRFQRPLSPEEIKKARNIAEKIISR